MSEHLAVAILTSAVPAGVVTALLIRWQDRAKRLREELALARVVQGTSLEMIDLLEERSKELHRQVRRVVQQSGPRDPRDPLLYDPMLFDLQDTRSDYPRHARQPRETIEIFELGQYEPVAVVEVGCEHVNRVDVELRTGEVVAQLCLDCDAQLPPDGAV